jgi:two-component system, cell cycle sensor histidine kinase and response regulator CckA
LARALHSRKYLPLWPSQSVHCPQFLKLMSMNKAAKTKGSAGPERFPRSQPDELGQLAAGITHEFNNLLTIIIGNCDLLLMDPQISGGPGPRATEIRNAAQRAVSITEKLRALSGRVNTTSRRVDLNSLVGNLNRMLQPLLGEGIDLKMELTPNLRPIQADAAQIEQVLTQLVINALESMPNGGTVTLRTGLGSTRESQGSGGDCAGQALISVSDTGCGIPAHAQARLFDPFFTTKFKSRGAGLGLTVCQSILERFDGRISFQTSEGHGSTFNVFLPFSPAGPPPTPEFRINGIQALDTGCTTRVP